MSRSLFPPDALAMKQLRQGITNLAARLFGSPRGQHFLDRAASRVDFWRGYGSGAYIESSGEAVLFDLVRRRDAADNAVIFDVGSNIGDFTAAAFQTLGAGVTVHAFEPAHEVFQRLSARFRGNDRIILNNVAAGCEAGEHSLFGVEHDSGMASLIQRKFRDEVFSTFQEPVKVIRLSDYCSARGIERINLLKTDVEGLELEVFRGAESLFKDRKIDICSFEFGGCNLDSRTFLRDFFDFFQAYRMEIFRITPAATLVPLYRYKEGLENFATTNYVAVCQM
jgi:FkbM family methyltransferase